MKCIKNSKNGNIIRVEDSVANRMVGSEWAFINKAEWKKMKNGTADEVVTAEETPKKNKKVKNDRKA